MVKANGVRGKGGRVRERAKEEGKRGKRISNERKKGNGNEQAGI